MGKFTGFFKTVLVPALISLGLYLILHYFLLPVIRRHRHRYSQYLPLQSISDRTTSASLRVLRALNTLDWRPRWANSLPVWRNYQNHHLYNDEELLDDELGEGMVGFDVNTIRREELEIQASHGIDNQRRLSRELEEGFRDESDEENKDGDPRLPQQSRSAGQRTPSNLN
ncbi:hypothetical protein L228DRAFT_171739 [Xylona heveae TC161]|uniref:Uncharacterized protein n=1 Tax=Xylona heveae (strain CBS 132557 / TC161) TaxID=1328760 RepID=A0A165FUV8_XYLHT|nr:hypothetical protein L228DRAFT_171739 [Xylona heveae TC161]KZF21409.1 hypothetical protein L228DRAFT_171739 [Xylona heveae TC161]